MEYRPPLRFKLNSSQRKYFDEHYASYFNGVTENPQPHSHPLLSLERSAAESAAIATIYRQRDTAIVLDVGGASTRHASALHAGDRRRASIHCCCPVLSHADAVRNATRSGSWCNRAAPGTLASTEHGTCDCVTFTDVLCVHSIYYLGPDEVVKLLLRAKANVANPSLISVHHRFAVAGSFALGEAQYHLCHRQGNSSDSSEPFDVRMQVCGNSTPYTHRLNLWLDSGYQVVRVSGVNVGLAWSTERIIGDSEVVRFTLTSAALAAPTIPLSLASAVDQRESAGEIDRTFGFGSKDPVAPTFVLEGIRTSRFFSRFAHIATVGSGPRNGPVEAIPKQLVDYIALEMAGRPRDLKTHELMLSKAREFSKRLNQDKRDLSSCLVSAVNLGFVLHLERETAAMGQVWDNVRKIERHNKMLKWDWPFWVPNLFSWIPKPSWNTHLLALALYHANGMAPNPRFNPYGWDTPEGPLPSNTLPTVCMHGRTLQEVNPDAKCIVEHQPCKPTIGLYKLGPGCDSLAPMIARNCTHNAELAVRNRVVGVVEAGKVSAWDQLITNTFLEYHHSLYPDVVVPPSLEDRQRLWKEERLCQVLAPVPFEQWVTSGNWSAAKTKILREAQARVLTGDIDWNHVAIVKGFIKIEGVSKRKCEEFEEYDPRAISARTPEFQVLTGPISASYSQFLKKNWGFVAGLPLRPITYAPGLNAVEIGRWLSQAIAEITPHGTPVGIQCDESRFDKHQINSVEKFERPMWRNRVKSNFKTQRTALDLASGRTRMFMKGVKASYDGRRKSGDNFTTTGNSEVNGLKTIDSALASIAWLGRDTPEMQAQCERLLSQAELLNIPIRILVAGDDLIGVTTTFISDAMCKYASIRTAELGFKSKFEVVPNPLRLEFCSGWFAPARVDDMEVYVLTPKLGRVLTRSFYAIKPPLDGTAWMRGVATALWHNLRHIPGASDYYEDLAGPGDTMPIAERHKFNIPVSYKVGYSRAINTAIEARYSLTRGEWDLLWGRLRAQAPSRKLEFSDLMVMVGVDIEDPTDLVETLSRAG